MEFGSHAECAPGRQRNVISRHQSIAEPVTNLELLQTTFVFVAIMESAIGKVGHSLRRAELHCLGKQGVRRPPLVVGNLRIQLQDGSYFPPVYQLKKPNEFVSIISADEVAAIKKS